MTLTVRPVRLKQSIYLRVPNDIADLIEIDKNSEITLNLIENEQQFLLTYAVRKTPRTISAPSHLARNIGEQVAPVAAGK